MQSEPPVLPYSTHERLFALVVMLMGFVMSAVIVSSVTMSMINMRLIGGKEHMHFFRLRQYLRNHNVPVHLVEH